MSYIELREAAICPPPASGAGVVVEKGYSGVGIKN